jgi:alkanesulfonate monooxygenase SsuD/methylene tetrahydromethanopterin reductase-like flavin-dependent oxidoreductase (luciferase family)
MASAESEDDLVPVLTMTFDLRHPPQFATTNRDLYAAALDIIEWADEHGFRRVALGEHHQSSDGYLPAPLVFAAAIGGRTKRIRTQISVLLGPLYDPVRLAEEIAVADLCLQGRLDPAVASGYVETDFDMFGTNYANRGQTMEELIPFLRQAWTGQPFEYRGMTIRVTPRPFQDPMRIYMGGGTRRTIERAVRLSDGWITPGGGELWEVYRQILRDHGKRDPGDYPTTGPMFLWVTTDDKEKALEKLEPHIRHQVDSYGEWTRRAGMENSGPYAGTDVRDAIRGVGNFQILNPEEAIALGNRLGRRGWLMFNPLMAGIAPVDAWKMLHLAEERVFPYLDDRKGDGS